MTACPITLYLDGAIYVNPPSSSSNDPAAFPDLGRISTSIIAGIEFYAGGASVPAKFNMTTNDCGVLLLWTRER